MQLGTERQDRCAAADCACPACSSYYGVASRIVGCCARAAIGHVAAAPPSIVMNSRRIRGYRGSRQFPSTEVQRGLVPKRVPVNERELAEAIGGDRTAWLGSRASNYGICQDRNPFELRREFLPDLAKRKFKDVFSVSGALAALQLRQGFWQVVSSRRAKLSSGFEPRNRPRK